ncbi:MAG TPA: hypothetical protein V6D19_18950 [Stenomitos sp.]
MKKQKSLLSDFLDWKQTYRSLSTIHRFILISVFGLQLDLYLDFWLGNAIPHGNYGILSFIYAATNNPWLATALDFPFGASSFYLAFWFLKKGTENSDIWAILLFAVTLASPGFF